MRAIIIAAGPADGRDFCGTSRQSVSLFQRHLSDSDYTKVASAFPDGIATVSGTTIGQNGANRTRWHKIDEGDVALLFRNNRLIGTGEVLAKHVSVPLAADFGWAAESESGLPYELITVIRDVCPQDVPRSTIWDVIGYQPHDHFGFRVLEGPRAERLCDWLSSQTDLNQDQRRDLVRRLLELEETDSEYVALGRREQGQWRRELFGSRTMAACAICGECLPVNVLVAAHIKPRRSCCHEERMDASNVIPVCVLGCDALFERGYIWAEDNGDIKVRQGATGAFKQRLSRLDRRRINDWRPERSRYFAEHRNQWLG